jgi:hypothetical protein
MRVLYAKLQCRSITQYNDTKAIVKTMESSAAKAGGTLAEASFPVNPQ